jgi:hypothetical protein
MTLTTENFSEMSMNNGGQYQHVGDYNQNGQKNALKTNGDNLRNKV